MYGGIGPEVVGITDTGDESWRNTDNTGAQHFGAAVDRYGNVYAGNLAAGALYDVMQLNQYSGIATWTYFHTTTAGHGFGVTCACADLDGNTYYSGAARRNTGDPIDGPHVISLDIDGNLRWEIALPGTFIVGDPATSVDLRNYGTNSIAVNYGNGRLIVTRAGNNLDPVSVAIPGEFVLDSADGSIVSSNTVIGGTPGAGLTAVGWDVIDNYYTVQSQNSVRRNGSVLFNTTDMSQSVEPIGFTFDLMRDYGDLYIANAFGDVFNLGRYRVQRYDATGAMVWGTAYTTDKMTTCISHRHGTVGAFGQLV